MVNILYEEIMPSKPGRDGLTGADVCKNFSRAVVVRELARVAVDDSEVIKLQPSPAHSKFEIPSQRIDAVKSCRINANARKAEENTAEMLEGRDVVWSRGSNASKPTTLARYTSLLRTRMNNIG